VQDNGDAGGAAVSGTTGFVGMNQIDALSQIFINAALGNTDLLGRIAGLSAYTDAFHLRPGVEIDSATPNGTLTVAGDIDLSGFRYASLNPLFQKTGVYGSGEPGALVIRAGGDLDVVGSISDGFLPAPGTPEDNGWVLQAGQQANSVETLLPIMLDSGTSFPNTPGLSLRYDIAINPGTINANAVIPTQVQLASDYVIPAGTRLAANVYDSSGNVLFAAGTVMASDTTVVAGSQLGAGSVLPGSVDIAAMTWPAGASLGVFNAAVTLSAGVTVPFEGIIPAGANVQMANTTAPTRPTGTSGTEGSIEAIAAMLPEGDLSWSMRLVAGADLSAADTRIVQPASVLKASGASGNLTLADSHNNVVANTTFYYYFYGSKNGPLPYSTDGSICESFVCAPGPSTVSVEASVPSVLRTGTGNLDLIAGGSFSEQSLYGVYTAGTQSPAIAADGTTPAGTTEANNPFNTPRGLSTDGTLLGAANADAATAVQASFQAWYPEHGGDVLLSAQGNVTGNIGLADGATRFVDSDQTGNWLWRQGGVGVSTAWWVNFGTFADTNVQAPTDASFVGFQGIGTLGGGNLTVIAGGNAGLGVTSGNSSSNSSGLDLVVASTGRVLADGTTIVQTGGGDLVLNIGGAYNAVSVANALSQDPNQFGDIIDLRGNINIHAGAIGTIGDIGATNDPADPRGVALQTVELTQPYAGPTIIPGDGTVQISTRGNLVLAGAGDAGMAAILDVNSIPQLNPDGTIAAPSGWGAWFTLWTPTTSVGLFSAGGDVAPQATLNHGNSNDNNSSGLYPGTLNLIAATGNIRFLGGTDIDGDANMLELMPSPQGQLEALAGTSIFGMGGIVAMSGADMAMLATPTHPVYGSATDGNASPNAPFVNVNAADPIAFGPDTPTTDLHAGDSQAALVYAGTDIVDLQIGAVQDFGPASRFHPDPQTWYIGAKPFQISAGRDIVGTGTGIGISASSTLAPDFILNDNGNDISTIQAGRDILYQSVDIGGPGLLDVEAGRNLYQGDKGTLESVGPIVDVDTANHSSGAGITAIAGVGPNGPDYADFAKLYFNAANQLPAGSPLAGSGKVPHAYDQELLTWLQQRFGYAGTSTDALTYFLALPNDQQGVFVRQVYYEELTLGGREFNDPTSTRFQSYLRGRDAIAALFPATDAQGNAIAYNGGITLFSAQISINPTSGLPDPVFNPKDTIKQLDGGIHTDFGGAIQILNPGGQTVVGVEGITPGADGGLITQGSGDIDIYSEGSILLGQSRIMTTFGGDILAWSATGDINAGRGSKTTVVFNPPLLVYDDTGDITLSPSVPSTGAGIATLAPIPEVPAGDVDLIAPLGTIDAGEAGIRVSGNVNLAALQVVNAANIAVQGKSTGLPLVATVNVGALTNASAAAAQAAMAAQDVVQRDRNAARQALPSIFTVRVLGFGSDPLDNGDTGSSSDQTGARNGYDAGSAIQVVGDGALTATQSAALTPEERRNWKP
jgi:hypothetical protein